MALLSNRVISNQSKIATFLDVGRYMRPLGDFYFCFLRIVGLRFTAFK